MQQSEPPAFDVRRYRAALRRDLDEDHARLTARNDLSPREKELLWMLSFGYGPLVARLERKQRTSREEAIFRACERTTEVRDLPDIADEIDPSSALESSADAEDERACVAA